MTEIPEALKKWREEHPEGVVTKTPWEKLREKPTRKLAIDAKCCECMGWEENAAMPAGLRTDIRDCTAKGCPLWDWRPYR